MRGRADRQRLLDQKEARLKEWSRRLDRLEIDHPVEKMKQWEARLIQFEKSNHEYYQLLNANREEQFRISQQLQAREAEVARKEQLLYDFDQKRMALEKHHQEALQKHKNMITFWENKVIQARQKAKKRLPLLPPMPVVPAASSPPRRGKKKQQQETQYLEEDLDFDPFGFTTG